MAANHRNDMQFATCYLYDYEMKQYVYLYGCKFEVERAAKEIRSKNEGVNPAGAHASHGCCIHFYRTMQEVHSKTIAIRNFAGNRSIRFDHLPHPIGG